MFRFMTTGPFVQSVLFHSRQCPDCADIRFKLYLAMDVEYTDWVYGSVAVCLFIWLTNASFCNFPPVPGVMRGSFLWDKHPFFVQLQTVWIHVKLQLFIDFVRNHEKL